MQRHCLLWEVFILDLKKIQEEIWQNKIEKEFNTTDVSKEFCLLYTELGEAYDAYRKKKENLGEEMADVAIFLLSLAKMLNIDLEKEIINKVAKNKRRVYKKLDGFQVKIDE